mgnify:CR=1 FL=1
MSCADDAGTMFAVFSHDAIEDYKITMRQGGQDQGSLRQHNEQVSLTPDQK